MIQKSIILPCARDAAFALFTERISEWWPPERRHTGDPKSAIVLSADGTFLERATDGREHALGAVLVWAPPNALVLDWYPGTDAEHPTRVSVSFVDEGEATRVMVQHGPTPASEELFDARAPRYEASWELVLSALEAWARLDMR